MHTYISLLVLERYRLNRHHPVDYFLGYGDCKTSYTRDHETIEPQRSLCFFFLVSRKVSFTYKALPLPFGNV